MGTQGRPQRVVGTGLWARRFAWEASIAFTQRNRGGFFWRLPGKAQGLEKLGVAKLCLQARTVSAGSGVLLRDAGGQSGLGKAKGNPYSLPDPKKVKEISSWVPASARLPDPSKELFGEGGEGFAI